MLRNLKFLLPWTKRSEVWVGLVFTFSNVLALSLGQTDLVSVFGLDLNAWSVDLLRLKLFNDTWPLSLALN